MRGNGKGNVVNFPKRIMHPLQPDVEVVFDKRVVTEKWPNIDNVHGPRIPRCIQRRRGSVEFAEFVNEHGSHLYTVRLDIPEEERDPKFFTSLEIHRGYVTLIFWQNMITAVCDD